MEHRSVDEDVLRSRILVGDADEGRAIHLWPEITTENARLEKEKVKFSATPDQRGGPGYDDLPERLRAYIAQGDRLFDRVQQFDKLERGGIAEAAPAANEGSIGDQLARLRAAFGRLQS